MNEIDEQENRNVRKFLKRVGVNSQKIIEDYDGPKNSIIMVLKIPKIIGVHAGETQYEYHNFEFGDTNEESA
jgi:hypothetical protein